MLLFFVCIKDLTQWTQWSKFQLFGNPKTWLQTVRQFHHWCLSILTPSILGVESFVYHSLKIPIGLTHEHIMKYMHYTAYYVYIYFLLTVEISKKNAVFCWWSPFWLVPTNTRWLMSARFLNPPGMEKADSHPALLYEALLPFLSKEDAQLRRRWFNRWEGTLIGPTIFSRVTKKPFPET